MASGKINLKTLRQKAALRGFFTVAAIARQVPCRRESIYGACNRPKVFPKVINRLKELFGE